MKMVKLLLWRIGLAFGLAAVLSMALPGTTVTVLDSVPARSAPLDQSVWFAVGFTEKGPAAPVLIESLAEYEATFGARVSYGLLYDSLDAYFREGGGRAYVSRVLGPAPVVASHTFNDSGAAASLVITAENAGEWGNSLSVAILAGDVGGNFKIQVSLSGTVVETSDDLADQAAAVAWGQGSSYVNVALGTSANDPAPDAAQALTGGADDRGNATDATWKTALDRFGRELGPGQVSMPGRSTAQSHTDLLAHAASKNRVALVDGADTGSKATLVTAAAAMRTNGRWGGMFAPWALIPGIAPGTTRTVPYSAIVAGIIARNDGAGVTPNQPSAGSEYGVARYAVGLSQPPWSDADREALNDAGVNVALTVNGAVTTYGYRTLADPVADPNFIFLSNSRLLVEVVARSDGVAATHLFRQIDGRGLELADFAGDLTAELIPYFNAGSLYGATPGEAFLVDVGPQVNPVDQLAQGILKARLHLKLSPFAERVVIEIVKRALTEVI